MRFVGLQSDILRYHARDRLSGLSVSVGLSLWVVNRRDGVRSPSVVSRVGGIPEIEHYSTALQLGKHLDVYRSDSRRATM